MTGRVLTRRQMLLSGSSAFGGLLLSGCDRLSNSPTFRHILDSAENLSYHGQRLLVGNRALAREYKVEDLSPIFRSNGTSAPETPAYNALLEDGFRQWRLRVDGTVSRTLALSLEDLRGMPARVQITRHDCVEGWSAIGRWKGVPLSAILDMARVGPTARYVVFHCADTLGRGEQPYYESLDLIDAFHPQTILAYDLNGDRLPIANGAPLRLRVERQLGYKHAKYLMRLQVVDDFTHIGAGKGGFWEDRGYAWYAGV